MQKHQIESNLGKLFCSLKRNLESHIDTELKDVEVKSIHKMVKPLDSRDSFRPISLSSCVSKLFERIILSRLLFFLESNSILSPHQSGFRPGRSTLDKILCLFRLISDGFNKPRPCSRTILDTIDFLEAFDSVCHPTLLHTLILTGLPFCYARWTQFFLSDRRACVVFQNHKSRSFRIRRGVLQRSVLGPFLYFSLSSSMISAFFRQLFFYVDNLTIWFSSPSDPTAVEASQGALFRLKL